MTFFILWSSCLKGGYLYTGARGEISHCSHLISLITLQLVHLLHWWLFLKRWLIFVVYFEKFGVDTVAQTWTLAFCSVHIVESGVLDVVCPSASCPQKCLICKAWKTIWGKQGTGYNLGTITEKWAYGGAALLMNGRFNRRMLLFLGVVAVCMPDATPLLVFDGTLKIVKIMCDINTPASNFHGLWMMWRNVFIRPLMPSIAQHMFMLIKFV